MTDNTRTWVTRSHMPLKVCWRCQCQVRVVSSVGLCSMCQPAKAPGPLHTEFLERDHDELPTRFFYEIDVDRISL